MSNITLATNQQSLLVTPVDATGAVITGGGGSGGSSITSSISSSAITTRGANTTAYAIDDVWGARFSLSLPTGLAADGTKSVILTKVNLTTSLTTLPTGFGSFRLFLFQNTTDSGNITDNSAFTQRTTAIDVDGYLLTQMQKATNDLGGRSTTFDLNVPMIVNSSVTAFFGYLVTNAAIPTPLANADTITIRAHFMVA